MINVEKTNSAVQLVELRDEEMATISGGMIEALLAALIVEGIKIDIDLLEQAWDELEKAVEADPCDDVSHDDQYSGLTGY